jgi:parallel beta-helix repeat protein
MLSIAFNIKPAKAEWTGTVYIRADGSIDPPDAPIVTYDNITYTLTDNIASTADGIIIQRDNIVVDGSGFELRREGSVGGNGIIINEKNNITVKNIKIVSFTYGISLVGSEKVLITENEVGACGSGIFINRSTSNSISNNFLIFNDIGIELNNWSIDNSIEGNDINGSFSIGIKLIQSAHNLIFNNLLFANHESGIYLNFSNNNTISRNEIIGSNYGIFIIASSYNDVDSNSFLYTDYGIYCEVSSQNSISGNRIYSLFGITLNGSRQTIVGGNYIDGAYGLFVINSSNNTLIGNAVDAFEAIRLEKSCKNSIHGNTIIWAVQSILLVDMSNNNEVTENIFRALEGIIIKNSTNNVISDNSVESILIGISLENSSNNKFYHNNFINMEHVKSHESINIWDDGYPSGGNYWSNYIGVDMYSGPYQNETGSDGIGDTPYVIDENNIDHYPLMNPYPSPPPKPPVITATIDIQPQTLNLMSKGRWITAYIELLEGYNVSDIDTATIMLNNTIPIDLEAPIEIGDYDNDTILDLMVKFDRATVCNFILSRGIKYGNVTLMLSGKLYDGTLFEGYDTIRVRMPGDINMDGKVDMKDISIICKAFGSFPNHPRWNPIADENEDNKIDIADIALTCRNFGKTYK